MLSTIKIPFSEREEEGALEFSTAATLTWYSEQACTREVATSLGTVTLPKYKKSQSAQAGGSPRPAADSLTSQGCEPSLSPTPWQQGLGDG